MSKITSPQLAIYIHWPYCARICPYCDFNVYKNKSNTDLVESILADLSAWRVWSGIRTIRSLHFGGGTPSLMRPSDIKAIIDHIEGLWGLSEASEIGLEANPMDASRTNWTDLKNAGISRLSLGVQSFNDVALKRLGRDHNASDAKLALEQTATLFDNFSVDLIYGWSGQSQSILERDLETALGFEPPHISTYQLTIESGTAFGKAEERGEQRAVDGDQSAHFYDQVAKKFGFLEYDHYEVSNFAQTGYQSLHNLSYWKGLDYVGVGPGAHGRLTVDNKRYATICARKPSTYSELVSKTGMGIEDKVALSPTEWSDEFLLMGLRISEGLALDHYGALGGKLNGLALKTLISDGFLHKSEGRLATTPKGRLVLNLITEQLLT